MLCSTSRSCCRHPSCADERSLAHQSSPTGAAIGRLLPIEGTNAYKLDNGLSSSPVKRAAGVLLLALAVSACVDDQVVLERGPLGPASYEVEVAAEGDTTDVREHRTATLRINPRESGADFELRTEAGSLITARLRRRDDGSVDLERVRGAPVDRSGEAELASLVGQLAPPLPREPVRIGESWSSSQRIRTSALLATLRTELGIARFRRIDSTDAADLEGTVTGRLRTTTTTGVLSGALRGKTRIAWAVRSGRVVAAETELVWTLSGGDQVTLKTRVRPR